MGWKWKQILSQTLDNAITLYENYKIRHYFSIITTTLKSQLEFSVG